MPIQSLIEYLDRRTHELTKARIHHANVDTHGKMFYLYVESEHDKPVPVDLSLDWKEIFGDVVCEITGEPTFVDDITVSKAGAQSLKDRIKELEDRLRLYEEAQ